MDLHHAHIYISEGDAREHVALLLKEQFDFEVHAHPDFYVYEEKSIGIDAARSLVLWMQGKPVKGDIKAALIIADTLTVEAQNALLKALEEPPQGTYIFIRLPHIGSVLPTLLSRVRVTTLDEKEGNDFAKSHAKKFFEGDIHERFALIRSLSKKEDKDDMKQLIASLEDVAAQSDIVTLRSKAKEILKAKTLVAARGSSPKMILEWLASVI